MCTHTILYNRETSPGDKKTWKKKSVKQTLIKRETLKRETLKQYTKEETQSIYI